MTATQLGRRVRRIRTEQGLSQREVAEPAISAAYLSLIESGQRHPSDEILEHVADRLGVDPEELLTGRSPGLEVSLEVELQEARSNLHKGDADTAAAAADSVLRTARKNDLERVEAKALTLRALVEEERGDLAGAAILFQEAVERWQGAPLHLHYEAVVGRARLEYLAGGARSAAYDLESYLLHLHREGINDPTAEARVQSTLIHIYRSLGLRDKELDAALRADELSVHVDQPDQIACLKINVASALIENGDYADAVDATREAERIYASLGWPVSRARSQIEGAIGEVGRGKFREARKLLMTALEVLHSSAPNSSERGYVLNELGHVERLMGTMDDALEHLEEARSLLPEKDVSELALNAREMGLCFVESNPKKAERELRRALELYREADVPNEVSATLLHIGRLQQSEGKTKQALKTLEEAVEATVGEVR